MLETYRANNQTDFRPDMPAFTMPTLLIHGDTDVSAPLEATAARTARAIPGSELRIYPAAAHGLVFTHKERLNEDIAAFAKADPPQAAGSRSHLTMK